MAVGQYHGTEVVFNATAFGGVTNADIMVMDQAATPLADASPDPGFAGVFSSAVRIGLMTYDLKQGIAAAGFGGSALAGAGFLAYLRPIAASGIRGNASSYLLTAATGSVFPRSLNATQGAPATFGLDVIPYNSSGTNPITFATSSASLNTPTQDQCYTLGPVFLNGTRLSGIQSVGISLGIQETVEFGDGDVWPKHVGIISRLPIITLSSLDVALFDQIDAGGLAVTQLDMYFRKGTLGGGGVVAEATSGHIKIAANVGMIDSPTIRGTRSEVSATFRPYVASGTAQIIMSSDEAIP